MASALPGAQRRRRPAVALWIADLERRQLSLVQEG